MVVDWGAILVVDENARFRAFACGLFARAGFRTAEASTGEDAMTAAREERPALVVLDVCLPDVSGFEVCQRLRSELWDDLPIVFVSADRIEALDRVAGLLLGGDDYLAKPVNADELLARTRRSLSRTKNQRAVPLRSPRGPALTERELEILQLLAEGRGSKQIAQELVISPKMVASHLQRVLAKLSAHSRAEAVAIAYRDGLVSAGATTADDAVIAHVGGRVASLEEQLVDAT
jgi:DNA-binding response OmpR family regulator